MQYRVIRVARTLSQFFAAVGSEQGAGNRIGPGFAAQDVEDGQAVECFGQMEIGEDQVRALRTHGSQGRLQPQGGGDMDAPALQQGEHAFEDGGIVVHAQHVQACNITRRRRCGGFAGCLRRSCQRYAQPEYAATTQA